MVRFHYITMLITEEMKPVVRQTPYCEGQGVINSPAPGANSSFILAKREGTFEKASIILQAGVTQGITVSCRMALLASNLPETVGTSNSSQ